MTTCPFCEIKDRDIVWSNDLVVAFKDAYPVSDGHILVVTRRHVATYFEATPWEQQALWQGVEEVKRLLDSELSPQGYNVGFNAGEAAGQTVMHLHVHVIPRFKGDVDDPRGGVRGVIPAKQKYDQDMPPGPTDDSPFTGLSRFVHGQEQHFGPVLTGAIRLADEIDLLSAFVQHSGINALEDELIDALDRGARVRILTGDYLGITHPHALQRLYTLSTQHHDLGVKLYRVTGGRSFHPKAYIFRRDSHGVAFVGSSNLSQTALYEGVEWNLRTSREDTAAFRQIQDRFNHLFDAPQAVNLTAEVVQNYRSRVRTPPAPEPANTLPRPHKIQGEVLQKLRRAREDGARRGLVVMATGLGKTFLSAFDFEQHGGERALFVAHREEILNQAMKSWSRVLPDRSIGLLAGGEHQPDADFVFASVQTLSRVRHLRQFAPDHFDYIVIDEFHHAAANSYRKLLDHFEPRFLLGLTATPNRMDGKALLNLCGDKIIAQVGLVEGISRGELVPFRYFGIRDSLDFEPIPWRSGRFNTEALTDAAATTDRASQALHEYLKHAPTQDRRTLVFCCSRRHADFMATYLRANGIATAAVHSGPSSDPRAESLERLRNGQLEAICAVDVFNEGVDLPDVNTILMLRPTESPIIFMQQLGRGLRKGRQTAKKELVVVDFIGNHRSFMVKPQALIALTGHDVPPGAALQQLRLQNFELPDGCAIEIETEVLDMLEKVARLSKDDQLIYTYLRLAGELGRRPSAQEVFGGGVHFKPVKDRYGTWFDFLAAQGDLTDPEAQVLKSHRPWFMDLMKTRMNRSYKMVALQVLTDADQLHGSMSVDDLARRSRRRLAHDPVLQAELREHEDAGEGPEGFVRRWREMPLRVFHSATGFSRQWFKLDGNTFVSNLNVAADEQEVFDSMTSELVDYRLAEFLSKHRYADRVLAFSAPIELAVSHSSSKPILRFDRKQRPDIPAGEVTVLVEGDPYILRFVKIACNVGQEPGGNTNVLPALMRRWFGPTAGQPGTRHRVELLRDDEDQWRLRPRRATATMGQLIPLGSVPYYPDLRVACGLSGEVPEGHDRQELIHVHSTVELNDKHHLVVRATGNSMDGGATPITDGALVLCELASVSGASLSELEGTPCLLTGGSPSETLAYLKVPVQKGGNWFLRSFNPDVPDKPIDPSVTLRVVAKVVEVVEERHDPTLWGLYDRDSIAGLFGHKNNPSWRVGHRDVELEDKPQTILMVNLRKPKNTPIEHRYADRFISPTEFQWESQASTAVADKKGQRIIHHERDGRPLHLFVRYLSKDGQGAPEPYTYCGTLHYLRHQGEQPLRVWFGLNDPLPERLWRTWSEQ